MRSLGNALRSPRRHLVLALVTLTVLGCHREGADMAAPAYGTASCAACGGVIDQAGFAAQYRLANGTVKSFDDPACLFEALRRTGDTPTLVRFHDYTADSWIDAGTAWFARPPGFYAPRKLLNERL